MPFDLAGWGVDIAIAGSQKGFMLSVGLAVLGDKPEGVGGHGDGKAAAHVL